MTPAAREAYSRKPCSGPLEVFRFSFCVEKVHHLEKEKFGVLVLCQEFWPKLVKGLLYGSYVFLACQLFYKFVQPMPLLKRWGNTSVQ